MKIIGIMGKAGAGKTTLAKEIANKLGGIARVGGGRKEFSRTQIVQIDAFAAPLKEFIQELCGFTYNQMYGTEKDVIDPGYGVTPRYVMQQFGTDFVRKVLGEGFWIKKLKKRIDEARRAGVLLFIIDDVRMQNEADFIIQEGTLVHVIRPNREVKLGAIESEHESEKIADAPGAMIFNNEGPIEELADRFFDQRRTIAKIPSN